MQYYVGCSGWSYTSWQGPFYPPTIANSGWLKYYSHVFDYVEIDSSFYSIPSPFMVKNWYERSTQNFRFTAKFPKIITHEKRLNDVDIELDRFLEAMRPLADKTLAYFGFDRTLFGDTIRKKNKKWYYELREDLRKDVEIERNVHEG